MSETVIKIEDVKVEGPVETIIETVSETIVDKAVQPVINVISDEMKKEIEKMIKDVMKAAIQELLAELRKTPLSSIDKDGDGVISVKEVKEAVEVQAQKLGCGPTCSIS
jgi:Ca2+-binding EF-hand superfamily protein